MSIEIPEWEPPWPVKAGAGFVRVTSTMTRSPHVAVCAEQIARKARPDVYPAERPPREPYAPGSFPLGLVRDAALLLLGEHNAFPSNAVASNAEDPTVDGSVSGGSIADRVRASVDAAIARSRDEWSSDVRPAVEAGLVGYLEVLESLRASGELADSMVFSTVVAAQEDPTRVEFWAWAVHHISRDGTQREVHVLRWQRASEIRLDRDEAAFIAHVAGSGFLSDADAPWWKPFTPSRSIAQPPVATTVRVRVVGVLDATTDLRFVGTAEDAEEAFLDLVPGTLGALAGGSMRPSRGCASCNVRHVCTGIPRFPGLLGVAGFSPYPRSLSPSDLWTHRACPRQLHLARDLGLPEDRREASDALRRGVQVHEWLALAHGRGRGCSEADLSAGTALHQELGWSDEEIAANLPYLRHHLTTCPLAAGDVTAVRDEVDITAWDTDANVVFSTRPDAAYLAADGRWVLRETKTLSPRNLPADRHDLLARYPQVAAAICLLADGYRPDTQPAHEPGRVELELLGPESAAVLTYDASDPATVLVARTELADRVDAWLFDAEHPIGERPPCTTCEVSRWCGQQPAGALEAATEGMTLTTPGSLSVQISPISDNPGAVGWDVHAPDAVLRDLMGTPSDEEEFPF